MNIKSEDIVRIVSYMHKIHHTRGRLRLRVSPQIKDESGDITLEDIESLPTKINGIDKLKINKLMGSITVIYDADIFPYELWENLIVGKNIEDLTKKINALYKEVM